MVATPDDKQIVETDEHAPSLVPDPNHPPSHPPYGLNSSISEGVQSDPSLQLGRAVHFTGSNPVEPDEQKSQSMPSDLNASTTKNVGNRRGSSTPRGTREGRKMSSQSLGRRGPRPSEEFDRRYDGPFAIPSRAMIRRGSTHDERRSMSHFTSLEREPEPGKEKVSEPLDAMGESSSGTEDVFLPEPPPLNYTLRTRKMSIFLWWSVIVFDSTIMPIALYFGLWYGVGPGTNTPDEKREKLSANTVFSIVTAAIGGASILEYFLRFWRLWKKSSTCRVMGAPTQRWYLDWFHWNFTLAWLIVMVELIVGSVPDEPYIRLLSMPLATMLYVFGTELILVDILRYFHIPAPVRISSVPKGAQLRPCIYSLIEDICAVDGSGGTAYREALDRRYEASHIFRAMLRRLGVFWAVGSQSMAVMCTILIFTVHADIAYTIGWSVPFVWAGVWTLCTFWYVKRELRQESKSWAEDVATKHAA